MHFSTADHSTYNQLPDVLDADKKLTALDRMKVLDTLCKTILKYDLEEVVGIRLLHNHNTIDQNEVMLEQEEINESGEYCLSTIATQKMNASLSARANSWKLGRGSCTPLEFSLDETVIERSGTAISNNEFLNEFYENLIELDAADILGPCIIHRNFFKQRMPGDASVLMLLESTDEERRANVLKFRDPGQYRPDQLIDTAWAAARPGHEIENDYTYVCVAGKCTPTCIVVIHCEKTPAGRHNSQSRHEKTAHWKEHTQTPVPTEPQQPPATEV